MTITRIPSLRTMSSKTTKVLEKICTTPMRRTGLGHGADDHFQHPSRTGNRLHYRNGAVVVEMAAC